MPNNKCDWCLTNQHGNKDSRLYKIIMGRDPKARLFDVCRPCWKAFRESSKDVYLDFDKPALKKG